MSRRALMESALAASTLPGAADFFLNWLSHAAPESHGAAHAAPPEPPLLTNYQPRFFEKVDFEVLESICSLLIPTDDMPGAKEARCAYYIDYVLAAAGEFAPERQRQWRSATKALRDSGFHAANASGREALLKQMSAPETSSTATHPAYPAYRLIKSENAFAYYTSRVGLIDNLDYRGNTYNAVFPGCDHPEHHQV